MLIIYSPRHLHKIIFCIIFCYFCNKFCEYCLILLHCQVCGLTPGRDDFRDEQFLCGFMTCKRELVSAYIHVAATMSEVCSQKVHCTNHPDLEEIGCSNMASNKTVCDGLCDDRSKGCEDESECNGYRYGVFCQPVPYYLAPIFVCDGLPQCVNDKRDEVYCREALSRKGFPSCISGKDTYERPRRVPIFNFTRCAAISYSVMTRKLQPYCSNYVDQTNCSDAQKISVRCNIQGYGLSTVSRIMVCGKFRVGLCADKMDIECVAKQRQKSDVTGVTNVLPSSQFLCHGLEMVLRIV